MPLLNWKRSRVTRQTGAAAEDVALAHLQAAGMALVTRGGGEIDLVMRAPDCTLLFVEVRARSGAAQGGAAATVGHVKQRRLVHAAQHYLMQHATPPPCRFDVVAIDGDRIEWLRVAFDAG